MDNIASILIVDDIDTNLEFFSTVLRAESYDIHLAKNGKAALEAINKSLPDLIILDIRMPKMSGYSVCKHLKSNPITASIPIIFITAFDTLENEEKSLLSGAVDYIPKPVYPAVLRARVKTQVQLKKQMDILSNKAMRDQLTNLFNRHYLLETANHRIARAIRKNKHVSVIALDIDNFKRINDTYGHIVGDIVITTVANLLIKESRTEDIAARLGGDEFLILLDECSILDAKQIAERICKKIENLKPNNINVTVSIGVAQLNNKEEDFTDLIKRADDAMYKAKKSGRNQACTLIV